MQTNYQILCDLCRDKFGSCCTGKVIGAEENLVNLQITLPDGSVFTKYDKHLHFAKEKLALRIIRKAFKDIPTDVTPVGPRVYLVVNKAKTGSAKAGSVDAAKI